MHGHEEWGTVLAAVAKKIRGCLSPHVTKCLVAREGVRLVGLCRALKWVIIEEIKEEMFKAQSGNVCCYTSRHENSVACFPTNLVFFSFV